MSLKIGIVMDPIQSITVKKDASFAMMLEAQKRGWAIRYMELGDLFIQQGIAYAKVQDINVQDNPKDWYTLTNPRTQALGELDIILMRKDPPVDQAYIYATYILELAEKQGAKVVNRPQALRDYNEKLAITHFPELTPNTLVSSNQAQIKSFIKDQGITILKPLDGMGGASIFKLSADDINLNVTIEMLTNYGKQLIMAQAFLPEITEKGDKRILMIDGEPFPHGLTRMPTTGEIRGNLAAGGTGLGAELTTRDDDICRAIGPKLKADGLVFVGIDVIGDHLTEINVTSPTCIRQIDAIFNTNVSAALMDAITA